MRDEAKKYIIDKLSGNMQLHANPSGLMSLEGEGHVVAYIDHVDGFIHDGDDEHVYCGQTAIRDVLEKFNWVRRVNTSGNLLLVETLDTWVLTLAPMPKYSLRRINGTLFVKVPIQPVQL